MTEKEQNIKNTNRLLKDALDDALEHLNEANNTLIRSFIPAIEALGGECTLCPSPAFFGMATGREYNVSKVTAGEHVIRFWEGSKEINIADELSVDDMYYVLGNVWSQCFVPREKDLA